MYVGKKEKNMQIKPLYDRVVVLPQKNENKNEFGIILPEINDEKSCFGEVVSTGDGQTFEGNKVEMQAKAGDRVIYSKFAGAPYKIDGTDYVIMRQADILAIVKGE